MPETKQIATQTEVNTVGSLIEIFTFYNEQDELPNTLSAFIAENAGSSSGVPYVGGELVIRLKNYPGDIDYSINSNGDLVVIAPDGSLYAIAADGNLTYTT